MAGPESSQWVADLQRRAAENPDIVFKPFDTYPWQADQLFNHNLTTALYSAEPNGSQLVEIALQLRIDRFAERIKIQIDKDAYKQWLSGSGSIQPRLFSDHILAQEVIGEVPPEQRRFAILHAALGHPPYEPPPELTDPSIPSWQRSAPRAELFVPKGAKRPGAGDGALPYPEKFEEIVKFLETGQTIPGIREIPDTVIEDPSISTRGTMQAPLKPWERANGNPPASSSNAAQDLAAPEGDTAIPEPGVPS